MNDLRIDKTQNIKLKYKFKCSAHEGYAIIKRTEEAYGAFEIEAVERFEEVSVYGMIESHQITYYCKLDGVLYILNINELETGYYRVTFQRCDQGDDHINFYENEEVFIESLFDDAGDIMARVWNKVRDCESEDTKDSRPRSGPSIFSSLFCVALAIPGKIGFLHFPF